MPATARLEFRIAPEDRALVEEAAGLIDQPVSVFARAAVSARAEQVLNEYHATTTVPAEYFDELLAALDQPGKANDRLAQAFQRLPAEVESD